VGTCIRVLSVYMETRSSRCTQYIDVSCRYLLSIAVSLTLSKSVSMDWGFRQHWASGSCGFGCPRAITQGYIVLNRDCYGRLKLMELLLPSGIAGERELLQ
jgi:hypothetical protein